jgi:hypothetical protein
LVISCRDEADVLDGHESDSHYITAFVLQPARADLREVFNALRYLDRTECAEDICP